MFRFVSYALFFLIGYRIIKLFFGDFTRPAASENDRNIGGMSVSKKSPPEKSDYRTDVEPEYIDYEEVK